MTVEEKKALFDEFVNFLESRGVDGRSLLEDEYDDSILMRQTVCGDLDMQEIAVGNTISFYLSDGERVVATAVRDDGDSILFVFNNALSEKYPMNHDGYNDNHNDMDMHLREVWKKFPKSLRNSVSGIRLLTAEEVFGSSEDYVPSDHPYRIDFFRDTRNRVCKLGEDSEERLTGWWLMNSISGDDLDFVYVYPDGDSGAREAGDTEGVRPAFSVSKEAF